ncbi:MAG TPA: ABC transporter substrate-binding protein [Actinomycetota bacterium]|nr:ABC transporter substrate-binding protein [Actinomycetota bacterium]
MPIAGDSTEDSGHQVEVRTGDGPAQDAEIRTFLIADVRGYTKFTREHGDHAAATLAATFAELVRQVVEAHRGVLLELRGDEALAMFISARQALRAAVQLQQRLEQTALPRGVGIGLDSGEAIPVGEGYRGGALNLAARLCSQAKPGEILASEAVIHLAAKVEGVAYVDPRIFKLKGYAEPVRALEVVPADRARIHRLRRRIGRRARRLVARPASRVALAGIVILALLGGLLPRLLGGGGTSILASDPAGMAILDAKSGTQLGFISTTQIKSPIWAQYADGHFWAFNADPPSLVEIDPKTGKVLHQIAPPVPDMGGVAISGNDLWVTEAEHPTLVRVDIRRGQEVERFTFSSPSESTGFDVGLLVAEGSVWMEAFKEILRIDPSTGGIQHAYSGIYHGGMASGDGSIWTGSDELVGSFFRGRGLIRIDPRTDAVFPSPEIGGDFSSVAAGGGFGWTAVPTKGVVYKIDPRGNVVDTYHTGEGAENVAFADGVLWVANADVGTVTGIDAITGKQTVYRFEHPLNGLAAGSGSLLVQLTEGRTFQDEINALQGKVARFVVGAHQLDDVDPATAFSTLAYEVEFATCPKLFNYPDKPSPEGWNLQPEVAASMPDVSADGRTYTFTIRPGYRFSPPSNQPVTAETFRHSIERALSPKLAPGWLGPYSIGSSYVNDIKGEQAFLAGKAPHVSGLRAEGDTLTIALVRPSPNLLERLAMPFFCLVPTDSPILPQGAVTRLGTNPNTTIDMVPSAGPYYIAETFGGKYTILKRNPNYRGPRPHRLDAIALREGIDPGLAVARVESGRWDGITNLGDAVMDPVGPLAMRWGRGGTLVRRGGQRYYPVPDGGLAMLWLNASRPLFSDRRVREAVSYALDRAALARIRGGALPTDQLLPPNQPGSLGRVFPLDGPDLQKARALMHGRRGTAVLVGDPTGPIPQEIKAELAQIGIEVRIRDAENPFAAIQRPGAPYDFKVTTYSIDPIGSLAYLQGSLSARPPGSALTGGGFPDGWKSPRMHALTTRLIHVPNEVAAFALLHGPIQREVPMTGISYSVAGEFFAPRVGCRVFPPASYGVDFAALCLTGG